MKHFKKIYVLPAVLLFVLGTALGVQLDSAMSDTDMMEQLRKLEDAFLIINKRYVEEVDAAGNPHEVFKGFEMERPGTLTPEEYDTMIRDITAFLSYAAEPVQLERRSLGIKVILFLVVFLIFAILLKKEIWKQVH